jgi:hypothetical protein
VISLRERQFDPDAVDAFQDLDPYQLAERDNSTETSRRILRIVA